NKIGKEKEITLEISDEIIKLSSGKHNQLQAEIISELYTRFFPKAKLLYLGDTSHKLKHSQDELLAKISIPITKHDKLPDLIFYDNERNLLFLVEAVTSHGPVSPKRHIEIEQTLSDCSVDRIYITAFPDFKLFKKHIDQIAWETEVWISNNPSHMIHFNGPKFLFVLDEK
ncbi:MAG: BsuBI/PstI family type II restriction endonuclease, partial [Candidatus Heimdallarchaeota archaeon]